MMPPQIGSWPAISGLPAPAAPYLPIEMIRKEEGARRSTRNDASSSTEELERRLRKRRRDRPQPTQPNLAQNVEPSKHAPTSAAAEVHKTSHDRINIVHVKVRKVVVLLEG